MNSYLTMKVFWLTKCSASDYLRFLKPDMYKKLNKQFLGKSIKYENKRLPLHID